MKLLRQSLCLFVFAGLLFSACKRDMFDPEAYNQIINEASAFSDIDPNQNWNLTSSHVSTVTANAVDAETVKRLMVLNGNPYTEKNVEILSEKQCAKGQSMILLYNTPTYMKEVYAALETSDGRWLLRKFAVGQKNVDFSADVLSYKETPDVTYQTYTYCYEDTYPEPGDNDFNDIVLRIQKLPSQADNEIRLRISLAAIGTLRQVAAAIRLTTFNYDDIESVTTEEGRVFDPNYSLQRIFIEKSDLLLEGLNGEAVLNLFEDAHYAMYPTINKETDGSFVTIRRYYNTSQVVNGTSSIQAAPKSLTYIIKLKSKPVLEFTLEDLDPFIMKDFNSGRWEVHTFNYKAAQILHDQGSSETANSTPMTWALKIPNGSFRYPQEEINIGYYKDGILTGAYMDYGHSFGQWVLNHNTSLDWFLYPSTGMVY